MNHPLAMSFTPFTRSVIFSRFRVNVSMVPHVKFSRRMFDVLSDSSMPRFCVAPMFCVTDDTPLDGGRKRCSSRSVVRVPYRSIDADIRLFQIDASTPTLVVCDNSHLRFELPTWLLNVYPGAAVSSNENGMLTRLACVEYGATASFPETPYATRSFSSSTKRLLRMNGSSLMRHAAETPGKNAHLFPALRRDEPSNRPLIWKRYRFCQS